MDFSLTKALRVSRNPRIAFVGAGGKTTAMFQLARELSPPVVVTTSTHVGAWQTQMADIHIATEATYLEELKDDFQNIVLVTGKRNADRFEPANENLLDWLHSYCMERAIALLIEADGSSQKPLKAWASHEPPIPGFVDLVVQVAGLSGLGKSLTDEHVHRADIFSKSSGLQLREKISPQSLVHVLTHREGGLKNIPLNARRIVLFNQADNAEIQSFAKTMTDSLLSVYQSIVIASLFNKQIYAVHEPTAGIILAAGGSRRFGMPKQLLNWNGQSFVHTVTQTAIKAKLSPVIVVTGSNAVQVEDALQGLDVKILRNDDWENGQASSIKKAISVLPPECGGSIFLLADQPQVSVSVLQALLEKHAEGMYPIIAPMVLDRRANPVLFDRNTFSDLSRLEGDIGGRAIFHKHRVEYLPWHDDGLLFDVDTPEQYQRLLLSKDL